MHNVMEFTCFIILIFVSMCGGAILQENAIHKKAVEENRGYYHPKTGQFTWNESGNCQK